MSPKEIKFEDLEKLGSGKKQLSPDELLGIIKDADLRTQKHDVGFYLTLFNYLSTNDEFRAKVLELLKNKIG